MLSLIAVLLLAAAPGSPAGPETLQVRHDHDPWSQCLGVLTLTDEGIEYASEKKEKHNRKWKWVDIQSFDRKSAEEFSILTYEDQSWKFGLDRFYNLTILPHQEGLSEEMFQRIARHLGKPVTDRIARQVDAVHRIPAKHLHTFGGCEGTLSFSKEWIVYETAHKSHTRTWNRSREVESVWSGNPFYIDLHIFEKQQHTFERTKRFRFQLKEPLEREFYEQLRRDLIVDW